MRIKTTLKSFIKEELNQVQSKITVDINNVQFEINENNIKVDNKNSIFTVVLVDINNQNNQAIITIKYNGDVAEVIGNDGISNKDDASKIFNIIESFINKNIKIHPTLQKLLDILKVENLYKN